MTEASDSFLRNAARLAAACLFAAAPVRAQSPGARPDSTPHPLSLVEALALAERESEAVGLARSDISRAEGQRRQARSGYFPQLTGTASYQRALRSQFSVFQRDTTDTATAPVPECAKFTPRPGLSASQVLFSGGRVSGQSQSASASVRNAELGLTAARAQVLLDVTQAYYDAALGDRLVRIAEATLEQADTTLSQSRLAQQVGNQSEFDLLRARVITSTLLTLLVIPTVYEILDDFRTWVGARFGRAPAHTRPVALPTPEPAPAE